MDYHNTIKFSVLREAKRGKGSIEGSASERKRKKVKVVAVPRTVLTGSPISDLRYSRETDGSVSRRRRKIN